VKSLPEAQAQVEAGVKVWGFNGAMLRCWPSPLCLNRQKHH